MSDANLALLQKKVRQIEIVSNRLVSERMAGEYHSVFKGQGMEFEEVRPYLPGDEIRSIDWNVTARTGSPHVKRYREERELSVFLIVDVSASCRFGTQVEFKSELMAEICAVLAFSTIANGDRVGLLLCSDQVELVLPPRKGKRHTLRLVREVLGFEASGGGTRLELALNQLRHVLHRRSIVFIVSDFLDTGYETELAAVARRHDVVAIAVEDEMERELPPLGLIEVVDSETGALQTVDCGDRKTREQYEEAQARRRQRRQEIMRRNEVDLIELTTDEPYAPELARFFRRRIRRMHA